VCVHDCLYGHGDQLSVLRLQNLQHQICMMSLGIGTLVAFRTSVDLPCVWLKRSVMRSSWQVELEIAKGVAATLKVGTTGARVTHTMSQHLLSIRAPATCPLLVRHCPMPQYQPSCCWYTRH
jgi:hypothetical protein